MGIFHPIHRILDLMHKQFLRYKHVAPLIFFLTIILVGFNTNMVLGQSVVGTVRTPVKISYDGKTKDYIATQNTVRGAISEAGIKLNKNDISVPPLNSLLNGSRENIQVIRALPVLISDNNHNYIAFSAYTKATNILHQLNVQIYPEDIVSTSLIMEPVTSGAIGQKITIIRAPVYSIKVDGGIKIARSWSKDVLTVIKKAGVSLGPQDLTSPAEGNSLVPGQIISVTRINQFDESETALIPFSTITQTSTSVPFGQSKTTQTGIDGTLQNTYQVTYQNGVLVSKTLVSSTVSAQEQDQIVATGILVGRANFGYYSGMVTSFFEGMTGHYLLVTNLANGEQVKVEIIGSGPFDGPLMDMGTAAYEAIGGSESSGFIPQVSVQLVD
jgi:uncharacterized protein YabE (DUF348 family)